MAGIQIYKCALNLVQGFIHQIAIARFNAPSSMSDFSQEYTIEPRSITANSSPSSFAKSRYCSTKTIAISLRPRR